jgi:hypothetical protein
MEEEMAGGGWRRLASDGEMAGEHLRHQTHPQVPIAWPDMAWGGPATYGLGTEVTRHGGALL